MDLTRLYGYCKRTFRQHRDVGVGTLLAEHLKRTSFLMRKLSCRDRALSNTSACSEMGERLPVVVMMAADDNVVVTDVCVCVCEGS